MKKETYAEKLAKLLEQATGVKVTEIKKEHDEQAKIRRGNLVEVPESKIQNLREAQGLTYFLQAPALFQYKVCPHCGADFLVSRMFVAYCSYTCIEKSLEEIGISWSRAGKIDEMIKEVYDGQEPIWIRNLDQLRSALEKLVNWQDSRSPSTPNAGQVPTSLPTSTSTR